MSPHFLQISGLHSKYVQFKVITVDEHFKLLHQPIQ